MVVLPVADLVALVLILKARCPIATSQFLRELSEHESPEYQKRLVLKGAALAAADGSAARWLADL